MVRAVGMAGDFANYYMFKISGLNILHCSKFVLQIDLRMDSTVKIIAPGVYPVVSFGPFSTPSAVLVSLSHAIG